MYWLLEGDRFQEPGHHRLVQALVARGIPHSVHDRFGISFDPKVPSRISGKVFAYGSVEFVRTIRDMAYDWACDIDDLSFQSPTQGDLMTVLGIDSLNGFEGYTTDAMTWLRCGYGRIEGHPDRMFSRPDEDGKAFCGKVRDEKDFVEQMEKVVRGYAWGSEILVRVAPVREILSEARFWVVKGRVVSGSLYRVDKELTSHYAAPDCPAGLVAQGFADRLCLETSVIDVAETADGWKAIEVNSINSAGFYSAGVIDVVEAMEGAYS